MKSERPCLIRWGVLPAIVVAIALAAFAAPGWAAPSITATAANPTHIPIGQRTEVTVTAQIADVQSTQTLTANLYRINGDGTETKLVQLKDDGSKADFAAGDGLFTGAQNFNVPALTTITLKVVVTYVLNTDRSVTRRIESAPFTLQTGNLLPANAGGTITGAGGVSVTVPPNSIPYAAFIAVNTVSASTIVAPRGNLGLVGAFELTIETPGAFGELPDPTKPFEVSFPAPPGTPPGGEYLIARQITFDSATLSGQDIVIGAPTPQLMPMAMATVIGTAVVTQPSAFAGVLTGGRYAVVEATGSGIVRGTVTEGGVAQAGVVVSNTSNTLITLTDPAGAYTLFVSAGPTAPGGGGFSVIGFHPLHGSAATAAGTIVNNGDTVTVDIALAPLTPAVNTRPGIRNGGFEQPTLAGTWDTTGDVQRIQSLGPTTALVANDGSGNYCAQGTADQVCTPVANTGGVSILPTEGKSMVVIDTGGGPGAVASSLAQVFTVPAGATTLRVDYNYVSEELPEWVGSQFQDPFRVVITPAGGPEQVVTQVTVNDAAALATIIGDCGFPGGDESCGSTGWRTASYNLAAYAGQTVTIKLLFDVTDLGDNIYDTRVLVDNIRFSTVWLDVKILNGAGSQGLASVTERVERDVAQANTVLSQAGINLRVRGIQTINDAAVTTPLLDVTVQYPHPLGTPSTCTGGGGNLLLGVDGVALTNRLMTAEETSLMNVNRSGTPAGAANGTTADANVYYVRSTVGAAFNGWTANPGDFCQQVSIVSNVNWGTLITDSASTRTLTHELGHALITAISDSPGTIMHACASAEGTCFTVSNAPATAIVTSTQSLAINTSAVGSTVLKP